MNRFLLSFVFLLTILFAFSGPEAYAQGREGGKGGELPPVLKGQEGTIDDLDNAYCESSVLPEIYVNPTNLPDPSDYDSVDWDLYYYDGGGNEVDRNDLLIPIGSAPNNGVRLDIPQIAAEGLFDTFLVIEYSFRRGLGTFGGDFDYTVIRKDPELFDLTIDNSAVCLGQDATLTLDGSESGYLYYLYRDGALQNAVGRNGNGSPISFIQSSLPVGTYSYYVVAHVDDDDVDCETQMDGTPTLSVYPNPTASPDYRPASGTSGDPICQGLPFELFDSAPETSGYVYNWTGPGLSGTVTGHTITVSDPVVLGNPGDYDYTLTIIDANNPTDCNASATVRVTVDDNPTAAPTISPVAVCEGSPVDIEANASGGTTPYSYTWSTTDNPSFSTVDQATITIDPTTLADGGDVYSVVVTDALGCVSTEADAPALVVNEEPSVTITGNSEVCEEDQITFNATDLGSGYTYQWYLDGASLGTGTSLTLGGGTYALPAVGTDYTISVDVTNSSTTCSTTESTLFTVNDKPEVSIDDPTEVCNGTTSFTLTADFDDGEGVFPDDYNIQWYKGGAPLTGETTETLTLTNLDETDDATYTVTVVHSTTGCSDSFDQTLTVHTVNPTLTASPSEIICADQNVTFTASGTDAFEYRFLLNGAEVQAFSTDDTWESNTLADGDEVTVEITDVNGCSDISAPVTMTVHERPTITTISNGGPYCVDDNPVELFSTVTGGDISTSGDYTYGWTAPSGFTSGDEDPSFGPATLTLAQTYTLVATDDNGCASDPSTTDVVVNALPNASAANDGPKCGNGNEDITLQGDPNGMATYEWFAPGDDPSTDAPIGLTQDYVLTNVVPGQSGIYTLKVINGNGCENITTTEVIVHELPEVSLGPDLEACRGDNVTLTATITNTTTGVYTYTWYVDTGSGWTLLTSGVDLDTYVISDVQLSDAASYSVIVNDGNTCASPRDALILTVNDLPTVTPNAADVCAGNDILLEGNPDDPDYSYSWSGPGLTGSVAGQDVTVSDNTVTDTPGTYIYTLTITNTVTGCSNSATVDVEVFENPTVSIDPVADICDGGQFTVTANVSGGSGTYDYSWTFDDGSGPVALAYNSNTFTVDPASLSDDGTYEVTVTDTGNPTGCATTANVAVVVNELPTVNLPDASTCDAQDIILTAAPSVGSGNYVNYIWYDGANSEIANGASNQLTLTGTDVALANDGATYSVTVEDDNGCVSAANDMTLTVNENPSVEIIYNANPETAIDVCLGSSMTLDAQGSGGTGTYNYTWTLPDGSTQSGVQLVINPIDLTDDGIYTVTVDDGNCTGTQTIDVTVVEVTATIAVTAPVAGATTICENTSVIFEAGGGSDYEFYLIDVSAGTTTMVHDASNEWTTSTLEDGDQVYVTATNALGCSDDSDPITMSVIANPTVAINYPAGEDNEICVGEDLPVVANPSGYSNYDFYVSDGTTDTKVSPDGYASETFTYSSGDLADGYEIYVVASSGAGCSGESAHETVVVHALPNATADNTGPECVNETVTLQGGDAGLDSYEWFAPGADLTTDAPIATSMDHDLTNIASSDAGIYTLRVTNVNGCQAIATTDVVVNELPVVSLPADYSVCEGTQNHEINGTITNGTAPYDVMWEFDDGSGATTVLNGQGETTYSIGSVSSANEGTYNVTVTDANSCVSVQDVLVLTVDPAPSVTLTSDQSAQNDEYCDGSSVTLTAAGSGGTVGGADPSDYQYVWYYEGTVISGVSTAQYTFTGQNGVNDGLYEVVAIDDNGAGCESAATSLTVTVHELPDATLDVDPEFFIEGTEVTFTAVDGYTSYEFLVNGSTEQGPGVDYVYQNSTLVDGDQVTVIVREDHGTVQCENSSTVTMSVFDSVDKPEVNVANAEYCAGDGGATVTVTNPQQDVTYELIDAPDGAEAGYGAITYDGTNTVSWSNVLDDNGGTSTPTSFEVKAYWSAVPADYQLSDAFDVTEHPVPNQYTMSVDGASAAGGITETDCNAGTGYTIGLFDGHEAVNYTLLLNGSQILEQKSGAGVLSSFTFDNNYSFIGTYTIVAENTNNCTTDILGSFTIQGDAVTVFDLNAEAGGLYCETDADGVELTLSGSESGVDYQLFRDGTLVSTFPGDGNAISLGNYTTEGQYNIQVTTSGGCIYPMNGVVDVTMIPTPDAGNLVATNGGEYCAGGTGVDITLEITQEDGVTYELFDVNTGTLIGLSVPGVAGNGDISFVTDFTTEGTYQVRALAGAIACPALSNEITVATNPLPVVYNVQQFDDLCFGGSGTIGIDNSESNVEYRWVDVNDNTNTGAWTNGNGSRLGLPVTAAGEYLIEAQNPITGCAVNMNGTVTVAEEPLPLDVAVTSTGGTGCNDPVVIAIDNPETDIEYQLYVDDGTSLTAFHNGGPISSSDGSTIAFDPIIAASTDFVVIATNPNTQCELELTDRINVDISGAIQPQVLEPESGEICNGDPGIQFELRDSETGVEYALIRAGATPADDVEKQRLSGNGARLTYAPVLEEGEYYVMGYPVDPTCEIEMANRVEVNVNPLPKAFNMIGPGAYCGGTGATLGIDNSEEDVSYVLQQHTPLGKDIIETKVGVAGEDTLFFSQPLLENSNNTYSVVAISSFGCTSSMKDSIEVEQNNSLDIPVIIDNVGIENDTVYFCDVPGGYYTIELDTPQMDNGIVYQVFDDAGSVVVETTVESATMDPLNVVDPGTYTVRASWADGACITEADTIRILGSAPAEDLHDPEYSSRVCYGDTISIKYPDDALGWTYQLMEISGTPATPVSRDTIFNAGGDTIVWNVVDEGKYFISIQSEGSVCAAVSSATIDISIAGQIQLPSFTDATYYYCHNADRVTIDITDVADVADGNYVYRLIDADGNSTGAVFNDDTDLFFEPLVGEDTPDAYGLLARDLDSGCEETMDVGDFAEVEMYPVPDQTITIEQDTIIFDPEAADPYEVGLSSYESRVQYEMYYESDDVLFSTTSDQPFSISTDEIEQEGDYIIYARHLDAPTCDPVIIGSVFFKEKGITSFNFSLFGNRSNYCEGELVRVILANSQPGVTYQLLRNNEPAGDPVPSYESGNPITLRDESYMDEIVFEDGIAVLNYDIIGTFGDEEPVLMTPDGEAIVATVHEKPTNKTIRMVSGNGEESLGGQCFPNDVINVLVESPDINNRYFVEYIHRDSLHLEGYAFKKVDSLDVNTYLDEIEIGVDTAGFYRVTVSNEGCPYQVLNDTVEVRQFRDPVAEDFLMRIPGNQISQVIDVMENAVTDPLLDITDYRYDTLYPVLSEEQPFSFIDADVEFIYDEYAGTKFEGSPFIQYTRPAGFIGKDSIRYSINIGVCPESKLDSGMITVIVGNEVLPNDDEILIPNAFSPNDDGMNDYFVLSGVPDEGQTTLMVFNRWGNLVYESKGRRYQNDWDGSANISNMVSIGQDLPNGVYFYIFSVKMTVDTTLETKEYNGYIELRR